MFKILKLQIAIIVLVAIVAGLAVLDVVLKNQAEHALAAAVEAKAPGTQGTTADISSFPFIGRLVVGGDVPEVTVTARETRAGELPLRDVAVTVRDVKVDLGEAVRGRLQITSIGSGTLSAMVSQDDLAGRVPGVKVTLVPGRADVTGPGGVKGELVTSKAGSLTLRAAGRTIELPLVRAGLLPCAPAVQIVQGGLSLSCTFSDIPDALLVAVNEG